MRDDLFGNGLHVVDRFLIWRTDVLAQDQLIDTGLVIDRQLVNELVTRTDQKVRFQLFQGLFPRQSGDRPALDLARPCQTLSKRA